VYLMLICWQRYAASATTQWRELLSAFTCCLDVPIEDM